MLKFKNKFWVKKIIDDTWTLVVDTRVGGPEVLSKVCKCGSTGCKNMSPDGPYLDLHSFYLKLFLLIYCNLTTSLPACEKKGWNCRFDL